MTGQTDNNLNYGHEIIRLFSFLERRRRRYMNEGLRKHGLQGTLFMYVNTINTYPGCSQDFLSEYLCIDKSNVARAAKKLELDGYISREVSRIDRRQYCMNLTEKGIALLPVIRNLLDEWSAEALEGLSAEDKKFAAAILQKMLDNVTP